MTTKKPLHSNDIKINNFYSSTFIFIKISLTIILSCCQLSNIRANQLYVNSTQSNTIIQHNVNDLREIINFTSTSERPSMNLNKYQNDGNSGYMANQSYVNSTLNGSNTLGNFGSMLQITKLNSSSVNISINLEKLQVHKNRGLFESEIVVRYRLLLDPTALVPRSFDPCQNSTNEFAVLHIEPNIYQRLIEVCKGRVFMFGGYDDPIDTDYSNLLKLCQPKYVYLKRSNETEPRSQLITGLWPSQKYLFSSEVHQRKWVKHSPIARDVSEKIICTNETAPLYPPQTDYGSFRIQLPREYDIKENSRATQLRLVHIYFRPVPIVMIGRDHVHMIRCIEEKSGLLSHVETFRDPLVGKVEVMMEIDKSYECTLWSKNPHGVSANKSIVKIPPQKYILDTGKQFQLSASVVEGNKYMLKWPDMNKLLRNKKVLSNQDLMSLSQNETLTKAYTIYWCMMGPSKELCPNIGGMLRTDKTEIALDIPGDPQVTIKHNFGISFRSGNILFTGIIWSDCVGSVRQEAQSVNNGLKIHTSGPQNETYITVNWHFQGCNAVTATIKKYEINYYHVSDLDPCGSNGYIVNNQLFEWDNTKIYYNFTFDNDLTFETKLENLKPSSLYAIRIGFIVNDTSSYITERARTTGATAASAQRKKECSTSQRSIIFMMALFALTLISLAVLYFAASKIISHYWNLLYRYKQTNTGIPQFFEDTLDDKDNLSEMGLKYWINRIPTTRGSKSELQNYRFDSRTNRITETSIRNNIDYDEGDEEEDNDQPLTVPDYVPSQLLTSQAGQSTPDNIESLNRRDSLSDTDDLSVSSHSSFLADILNDEPDSDNNKIYSIT